LVPEDRSKANRSPTASANRIPACRAATAEAPRGAANRQI
jgi:hypothetical protein